MTTVKHAGRIYLDHAATTPVAPEVFRAMDPYFCTLFGNPSSSHSFGRDAKSAIESSRGAVSSLIGAKPSEIVFTSSATESNNTVLKGVAASLRGRGNHILTTAIEHRSVLDTCAFLERDGFKITCLPVDSHGRVDPDDVKRAITSRTILISVMHANNEIGTIQPIAEIGRIGREYGVPVHTDAVQSFGHLPVLVDELQVDYLSASAHKLYGPKGVGMLYVRSGSRIQPLLHGGAQENGLRASTLNVSGIIGFGAAVRLARVSMLDEIALLTRLRLRLIEGLTNTIKKAFLNGHPVHRLPGNVHMSFPKAEGELMLRELDEEGIACSTSSACSASRSGPSHVLTALHMPHSHVASSLRITLGRMTTEGEIDRFIAVLQGIVRKVRALQEFDSF
ncbi:MAG TPA: cysteine desulfurase family protein [Dissulfurispiraceae bacterium]|nr:cysteine desulfurase family protein [Dissulfurispiraceae bacterium]